MNKAQKRFPDQLVQVNTDGNEILVFDTPAKFVDLVAKQHLSQGGEGWTGQSTTDCFKFAKSGDARLVPEAERQIAKLQTTLPDLAPSWGADIAGDLVVVPEFIVGIPEHMRRKIPNETTSAPLKVVFDTTSSGGIDHKKLTLRATTILALLMRLVVERPVEFWLAGIYDCPEDIGMMVRLPTAPLNLGLAAHLLTSVAFTRDFMYGTAHALGWGGGWNKSYNGAMSSEKKLTAAMRKFFDCQDSDLMIPPAVCGYGASEDIWRTPIEWINKRLKKGREYDTD